MFCPAGCPQQHLQWKVDHIAGFAHKLDMRRIGFGPNFGKPFHDPFHREMFQCFMHVLALDGLKSIKIQAQSIQRESGVAQEALRFFQRIG